MNNNNVIFKRTKRKMKSKKKRSERKLSLSPPGTRHHHLRSSSVSPASASQNRRLSWQQQQPLASDEPGFIVFCFDREDGGFDVVREGKEERKEVQFSLEKSPRTVNRKLIYGDQGEVKTEKVNSLEIKGTEQDQGDKTTCQEIEDVSCDSHDQKNEEEDVDASDKSSGSSHSEERRGSFAFPILGVEWMGSPVQMPKTDDLSPKKQKPIALGFQCCRF
ncbi:Protein BREAKING OF ASYMMETRY IN THE STOMATAL LINEAGE [Hirschfeldia incana]|nr:Protein BREAKING OF ASYMMETRY IN THE STOMATAL LINEAGE [Hirschfeldia incana]